MTIWLSKTLVALQTQSTKELLSKTSAVSLLEPPRELNLLKSKSKLPLNMAPLENATPLSPMPLTPLLVDSFTETPLMKLLDNSLPTETSRRSRASPQTTSQSYQLAPSSSGERLVHLHTVTSKSPKETAKLAPTSVPTP